MIDRLLFQHPRSVGESYAEHAVAASQIGARMMLGGAACLVHAIVPSLCVRTGSTMIKQLYAEMKSRQPNHAARRPAFDEPDWQLEYEI